MSTIERRIISSLRWNTLENNSTAGSKKMYRSYCVVNILGSERTSERGRTTTETSRRDERKSESGGKKEKDGDEDREQEARREKGRESEREEDPRAKGCDLKRWRLRHARSNRQIPFVVGAPDLGPYLIQGAETVLLLVRTEDHMHLKKFSRAPL